VIFITRKFMYLFFENDLFSNEKQILFLYISTWLERHVCQQLLLFFFLPGESGMTALKIKIDTSSSTNKKLRSNNKALNQPPHGSSPV
ncbi:hypothetical protein ACJX0J_040467, partial [Zea mays]